MLPAPGPPPQANPQASNLCPALKPRRLIAASDKNAPESAGYRAALAEAGTALVSPLVLTEADHLAKAQFGSDARSALVDFIIFQARRGQFHIPEITIELLETARQVQRKHAGLDLDLANGVNLALAAEYRTCSVLILGPPRFPRDPPAHPTSAFRLLPRRHVTSRRGLALRLPDGQGFPPGCQGSAPPPDA